MVEVLLRQSWDMAFHLKCHLFYALKKPIRLIERSDSLFFIITERSDSLLLCYIYIEYISVQRLCTPVRNADLGQICPARRLKYETMEKNTGETLQHSSNSYI